MIFVRLVIITALVAATYTNAQKLPRLTSTITFNQIQYFGIAKHLDDLDSIVVVSNAGSLELIHYSMNEVLETTIFGPDEAATFARYLANYEAFMHQQPDPFIADTAIRAMLRYLRPWKGYQSSATRVIIELREGINLTGTILAVGETHLAFAKETSADSVSVGVSRRRYRLVSFMDIKRFRLADDPTTLIDVQGSAPFIHRALLELDVETMYADAVPPEIEEDLHLVVRAETPTVRKETAGLTVPDTEYTSWTSISAMAGAQWVLALPTTVTYNQISPSEIRSGSTTSASQDIAMAFSAAVVVPAFGPIDLGGEFSALIQPSTAGEQQVVNGFDAYQLRLVGTLHLLHSEHRAVRPLDIYVVAGVGASYVEHRLQGTVAFGGTTIDVPAEVRLWQPTVRLGLGFAFAISHQFDLVLEGSGQYSTGGSYESEGVPYRAYASNTVGAYWLTSEDMSSSTAGVQLGIRYRIGHSK